MRKSPRSRLIRVQSRDFLRLESFFTQDWKLIIEFLILPVRISKKVSSWQLRLIESSCSGVGNVSLLTVSCWILFSFSWIFKSVGPVSSISYSISFMSRSSCIKDPTSLLPVTMSTCGLLSEAWLRKVSAAAAKATSMNLGWLRIELLID